MWTNRLMSFASVGVLICCLVLMGSAALVSANVSNMMGWLGKQNVIMVFMDDSFGGSESEIAVMEARLKGVGNVEINEYIPRADAYKSIIGRMSGSYEMLDSVGDAGDFLPDAFTLTVQDLTGFRDTVDRLKETQGILSVSSSAELVEKLQSINKVITVVGIWIVGMLFVVSLFIITNTIKLTMYVRRLEISIMKSVGATDWFIRMPFLVEGMLIGIISGLVAFGLVTYIYFTAVQATSSISSFATIGYSRVWHYCLTGFVSAGVAAGSVGSTFSIRKYLRSEGAISAASI